MVLVLICVVLGMKETMDLILIIVIPSVAGVIVITVFLLLCCKYRRVIRMRRTSTRRNKTKYRSCVITVGTRDDKGDLISVILSDTELSKQTSISSTLQKNKPCHLNDDVDDDMDADEDMDDNKEENNVGESAKMTNEIDVENIIQVENNREKTGHGSSDNLQTTAYLSMDKPKGIRKCHTFCGAPSKPYLIHDTEGIDSPPLPQEWSLGHESSAPPRSMYNNGGPTPASYVRATEESEETSDSRRNRSKTLGSVPIPKATKLLTDGKPNNPQRNVLSDEVDADEESLSSSYEDMKRLALYRSSQSINRDSLVMDNLMQFHLRDSSSRPSSFANSVDV